MIRRSGSWCIGRCAARNCAIPASAPMRQKKGGQRCAHCPLDRLDAAQCAEKGLLIRRALDLMGALKLGVQIGLLRDSRGRVLRNADHRRGAGPAGPGEGAGKRTVSVPCAD
jgi:hypothetical protein